MPDPPPEIGMMALLAAVPWAMGAGLIFLSAVALVFCGILFAKIRRRRARAAEGTGGARGTGISDVLGAVLKRTHVPESDGVRWDVSIYPESLSVPGYVILTAIFQNAYNQPRTVTLEVAPDTLLPHGLSCSVALNPGEAGILRTPLFVSRNLPPGIYGLRATLKGSAPRGEGMRLLESPSHRHRGPQAASLRVISFHDHPPVNLFVYDWKGFTSLYNPPQTAPDVTEVRILQELASGPSEEDQGGRSG
jgi:hypothetical protein